MMKYAADIRTVFFLIFIFLFQAGLFFVDFSKSPVLLGLAVIIVNSLLVFIISLINHNQRHVPIFKSSFLNSIVDFSLSLMMGSPAARLSTIHEINHHEEFQRGDDWSRYSNAKG